MSNLSVSEEQGRYPISVVFYERKKQGSNQSYCMVEVAQENWCWGPDGEQQNRDFYPGEVYINYPLGKNWKAVKKEYPTFKDVLNKIGTLSDAMFNPTAEEYVVQVLEGHQGLYDDATVSSYVPKRRRKYKTSY